MFRRRPPRRPLGRRPPRRSPRSVPPALREAERLFRQGRYKEAARRFAELAEKSARQGLWQPAGRLHLRAGRAFIQAGQVEPAMEHARKALRAMMRARRPRLAQQMLRQIVMALEERGYHDQAEALRREVAEVNKLPPRPLQATPRFELPTNCPSCGAALKPESYRRIRPNTVECVYCGTLVQSKAAE